MANAYLYSILATASIFTLLALSLNIITGYAGQAMMGIAAFFGIGAYTAAMNGVDAITFPGGIGENDCSVREDVCANLGYLGITMDKEQNKKRGENFILSTADSKVKVAVIPTNEELAICRETVELVTK